MMIVAVGSQNPAKVKAVKDIFEEMGCDEITIVPVDAPSEVNAMPFSDKETMMGAINRARILHFTLQSRHIDWA